MNEWKPIETVPTAASNMDRAPRVLIFDPIENIVCEARASANGDYYDPVYDEWSGTGATHWMPLPDPPKTAGK